jgi:hypothetical protein
MGHPARKCSIVIPAVVRFLVSLQSAYSTTTCGALYVAGVIRSCQEPRNGILYMPLDGMVVGMRLKEFVPSFPRL